MRLSHSQASTQLSSFQLSILEACNRAFGGRGAGYKAAQLLHKTICIRLTSHKFIFTTCRVVALVASFHCQVRGRVKQEQTVGKPGALRHYGVIPHHHEERVKLWVKTCKIVAGKLMGE